MECLPKPSLSSRSRLASLHFQSFPSSNVKLRNTHLCWTCPRTAKRQRGHRGRGEPLQIFTSRGVINLHKAIGLWRTAVFRYLSSLFSNHFSFIRDFQVESDRTGWQMGADIHKGHATGFKPHNSVYRDDSYLRKHLTLWALIHAPCINGYINTCIHVRLVSRNPFKDTQRWRAEALNPSKDRIEMTYSSVFSHIHVPLLTQGSSMGHMAEKSHACSWKVTCPILHFLCVCCYPDITRGWWWWEGETLLGRFNWVWQRTNGIQRAVSQLNSPNTLGPIQFFFFKFFNTFTVTTLFYSLPGAS